MWFYEKVLPKHFKPSCLCNFLGHTKSYLCTKDGAGVYSNNREKEYKFQIGSILLAYLPQSFLFLFNSWSVDFFSIEKWFFNQSIIFGSKWVAGSFLITHQQKREKSYISILRMRVTRVSRVATIQFKSCISLLLIKIIKCHRH